MPYTLEKISFISQMDLYAAVLLAPVAIFIMFHLLLLEVVFQQLIVRTKNRSQVLGKGILASIVWVLPTLIVLFIWLLNIMSFYREERGIYQSILAPVLTVATSVIYGLVAWGLLHWVINPDNEELGIWESQGWRT